METMRDGLPASYDAWRTAEPPYFSEPYYWDCPVCDEEGIGEDERCPNCKHYEDDDKWYCEDCCQIAWVNSPCYCCNKTEKEQEEKEDEEQEENEDC